MNGVLRRFQQYFSHITATAHIIHVFLGFTSTRLGSEVSCPRTLPRKKTQRIQCGSNPGPLDYESNTLPLGHAGPLNVTQNMKVVFLRIENIVGKEENAGYQHFLLFPQRFQKASCHCVVNG